ncbi:MAG: hypothetical protein ACOCSR_04685, partial [Wenzhouxiangella sp.]
AEPMELPELNVLESDEEAAPLPEGEAVPEDGEERGGLGFEFTRPEDGAELPQPAGGLIVELEIDIDIPPSAQIVLYLDDQPLEPVHSLQTSIDPPPPGDFRLRAELQTPGGRVLASTEEIEFRILEPGARARPEQ